MSKINWAEQTAQDIKNLVRGLNPIMGAYTFLDNKKVKLWRVNVLSFEEFYKRFNINNLENYQNGTVIMADNKKGLFFKAKDGAIEVLEIQEENARKMPVLDFLRGKRINPMTKKE